MPSWPVWFLIVAIAIAALALYVHTEHKRWKRGWLSELIEVRLASAKRRRARGRAARPQGFRQLANAVRLTMVERWDELLAYMRGPLASQLRSPHFPSAPSFALVACAVALFFVVPRPPSLTIALHSNWQDWWRSLTTDLETPGTKIGELIVGAFTGLAVVVIALVVFVAESIRDDNDFERKRVLVRVSWLWPLGLAATLIPFGFLWSAARGATVLLEAVVAGLTMLAFARVLRSLLDPDTRARNRFSLLRDRVRGMILASVRERIGNSVLLEQLGDGKRIDTFQYTLLRSWIEDDAQGYEFIDAPEDGWLSDIQLDELMMLGERLDRYARDALGFSLREGGPKAQASIGGGVQQQTGPRISVHKAYLLKRFREEIPPDSVFYGKQRSLLALPKVLADNASLMADIHAGIPHIFRFTKEEPTSVAVRREMQGTKDQLAQAIRDHALGAIGDLRQMYLQVAEEFLTQLVEFGGGYSAEQAEKERGNFLESWSEVRWLLTDLRELIIIAVNAGNTDALATIGFLPFAIAIRAVQVRDHYLFQQFYQFASLLYVLAKEQPPESPVRERLTEHSWRWPKEVAEFYVARELSSKSVLAPVLEQLRGFATYSLRVFQDVMRLMADNRDVKAFETAAREFRRLFSTFREDKLQPSVAVLRMQRDQTQSEAQRAGIDAQIARVEKRNQIAEFLDMAVDEIFLALGGRLLAQRVADPQDEAIERLLSMIKGSLPRTIESLAAVFAEASDWRTSDLWGWDQWDLVMDGRAHYVDKHSKLNQVFSVRSLEMLAAMSPEARAAVRLPLSNSLAEMARETNAQGLLATLAGMEQDPERWQPVLSEAARACIPVLRDRLVEVWDGEQAQKAERTRNAVLDTKKFKEFREELTRNFVEGARLRALLRAKNVIEMKLNEHPGRPVRSLGFNQVDDKDAFIAQEHTSYAGWGRAYGEGLARGEDSTAYAELIKQAGTKRNIFAGDTFGAISRATKESKIKDAVVLQSLGFPTENSEIRSHRAFLPSYDRSLEASPWREFNGFMGVLSIDGRQIPIFDAFADSVESQNKVLVMDAQRFIRWRQYAPDDAPEDRDHIYGELLIRVIDLNENREQREAIIAEHPPWLATEADPSAHLRTRVLVNVYEKFRIEILDPEAAVCLSLTTGPGPNAA